jgi:hypothetical protein
MTDKEIEQYIQKIAGAKINELREDYVALADRLRQLQTLAATGKGKMITERPASLQRLSQGERDELVQAKLDQVSLEDCVRATVGDEIVNDPNKWQALVRRYGATIR